MTTQVLPGIRIQEPAASEPQLPVNMPRFTFAATMGRKSIEEIKTDLVLVTMLHRMSVPGSLKLKTPEVAELVKQTIKAKNFDGKSGSRLLIETSLKKTDGEAGRHVLLVGLGRASCYKADTAYNVVQLLVDEAIQVGARTVTIPFVPNRMTEGCLNLKATAFKLKCAVAQRFSELDGEVSLKEIQIYCTPQAKRHIQQGLEIPLEAESDCRC